MYLFGINLFDDIGLNLVARIGLALSYASFDSTTFIFNQDQIGSDLYVASSGQSYLYRNGIFLRRLDPGMYIGELSLFPTFSVEYNRKIRHHVCAVKTLTFCEFLTLTFDDIKMALHNYPDELQELHESFMRSFPGEKNLTKYLEVPRSVLNSSALKKTRKPWLRDIAQVGTAPQLTRTIPLRVQILLKRWIARTKTKYKRSFQRAEVIRKSSRASRIKPELLPLRSFGVSQSKSSRASKKRTSNSRESDNNNNNFFNAVRKRKKSNSEKTPTLAPGISSNQAGKIAGDILVAEDNDFMVYGDETQETADPHISRLLKLESDHGSPFINNEQVAQELLNSNNNTSASSTYYNGSNHKKLLNIHNTSDNNNHTPQHPNHHNTKHHNKQYDLPSPNNPNTEVVSHVN
eukprot:UN25609